MGNYLAEYSEEEFSEKLIGQFETMVAPACLSPHDRPQAILLGGQSGAGKTTLHHVFLEMFKKDVIIVNGDEYRKLHPRFSALQSAYGDKAVDYTAQWAGKMVEAIVDALSSAGYNLIIEGTLRTSEVPLATATLLRERGYDVSLALMAVKPEISLVSCQLRYEQMRLAGTTPRATDPAHHRKIVDQIVRNLTVLEDSGMFDQVYLYNRSRERLCPQEGLAMTASQMLEETLFGSWSEEEFKHYASLKAELGRLQRKS